jgi:hypothetical protein
LYTCSVKKILIALLATSTLFACKSAKKGNSVKFEIAVTSDYCGGAAPSDELIKELKTPKPYTGVLYIHNDTQREDDGIKLKFNKGTATVTGLNPGQYFGFMDKKIDFKSDPTVVAVRPKKRSDTIIDTNCLEEHNTTPNYTFSLEESTTQKSDTIHKRCNPCIPPAP